MAEPGPGRPAADGDVGAIVGVINDAAAAYRGVISPDCWHEPYMTEADVRREIADGVRFWIVEEDGAAVAAMGLQHVRDVTLIRHAYVRRSHQRRGVGSALLTQLRSQTQRPLLVGTWRAATWAVSFYRRHGFRLLDADATRRLLERYWTVPERQMQESVVLAEGRWAATTKTDLARP